MASNNFQIFSAPNIIENTIKIIEQKTTTLNVLSFGAKGNNSTDDTAAFQQFLDTCISLKYDGYIPAGTYKISGQLTCNVTNVAPKAINIRGAGRDNTILQFQTSSPSPNFYIYSTTGSDTFYGTLVDFSIYGNVNGSVFALGRSDVSDAHNGWELRLTIGNGNTGTSAVCADFGYVLASRINIVCSGSNTGLVRTNGLASILCRQCAFNSFWGSGSGMKYGIYITQGYNFANQFNTMDIEVVGTGIFIDVAQAARNIFLGCQYEYSIAAIKTTAGDDNCVINGNFAGSVSPIDAVVGSLGETVQGQINVSAFYPYAPITIQQIASGNGYISNFASAKNLTFEQVGNGQILFYANSVLAMQVLSTGIKNLSTTANRYNTSYLISAAVNGGTTVFPVDTEKVILNPAGVIATHTVTLPTPLGNGQTVSISATDTVTAITVDGGTVLGAPSTLIKGNSISFVYDLGTTTWYIV